MQFFQQGVNAHAVGFAIKPRVSTYFESGPFKDGDMVFPGRIANPDAGVREVALQEIGTHLQRAGATERLDSRNAVRLQHRMFSTKQQRRDGVTVARQAFHWQIERCAMRLGVQARLRFGHGLQLWDQAVFVVVQADAEVYLIATGIFFETLHQRQNGVASVGVNVLKHAVVLQVYRRGFKHNKPEADRDRGVVSICRPGKRSAAGRKH